MTLSSIERQSIIVAMRTFESYLDSAEMALDDPTATKAMLFFDRFEKTCHDKEILKHKSKEFREELKAAKPRIAVHYRTLVSTFLGSVS